jgi:hypothetical protein
MVGKLFEQIKKLAEKCQNKGREKDAEIVLLLAVNCGNEIPIEQKQEAIMSILTLHPYYTPFTDVSLVF